MPRGRSKSLAIAVCTKCHRPVVLTENLDNRTVSFEQCPCCNDKHYVDPVDRLWRYLER
uniref:DNA-directed RNA polymerase n=1 Tax=Siphoviridae sp. ctgBD49 TaxID=2826420 RepID=A0A8S5QPE4_9CAUD|nr:MAG TPA: DNA-directed RNA polymerase [Siphoviridae sp. ctgBD49]